MDQFSEFNNQYCKNCGFPLRGSEKTHCPECSRGNLVQNLMMLCLQESREWAKVKTGPDARNMEGEMRDTYFETLDFRSINGGSYPTGARWIPGAVPAV